MEIESDIQPRFNWNLYLSLKFGEMELSHLIDLHRTNRVIRAYFFKTETLSRYVFLMNGPLWN